MDEEEMNNGDFEEEIDNNVVILTDEDGNDVEFEWLDTIELNDKKYIVVIPSDEDNDEVVILKMEMEDNEETFVGLDSEEEINEVYEAFKLKNKETFEFAD